MMLITLLSIGMILSLGYAVYLQKRLRTLESWMLLNDKWLERVSHHVNEVEQHVKRRGA